MNPNQKLSCRTPRNHVRVLDRTGSDLVHVSRTLLIDGVAVPFDYLSVSGHPGGGTELRFRIPRSRIVINRDRFDEVTGVSLLDESEAGETSVAGRPLMVAEYGLELIESPDGKQWADLTLLPTTIRFDRDEA